jgi:transcriptional regulator with XRE-family HTH domain
MGRGKAEQPKRLAEKLRAARVRQGWTQKQMFEALRGQGRKLHLGYIACYETGKSIPSLLILLTYARVCQIPLEAILDDEMEI